MSKGKSDKTTCKPYDQGRARLMPPGVDEIIPESHLARLASEATDELGMARGRHENLRLVAGRADASLR